MSFPFNITNPGIYISGLLTTVEQQFVTDLVLAGATASENDVLTWKSGAPSWEPPTGGGGGDITVREIDGTPNVTTVTEIRVPNGSLTDIGGGVVQLDFTSYTDEQAQDAVGNILVDSSEINFTYNDGTPSITAVIVAGSIDESKLDASVNASLDLADSASQPGHTHTIANITGLQTTLDGLQTESQVVSSSLTAVLDSYYINVANATYTDPTPTEGKGFIVFVRNGTATVGGTGYGTAGTIVHRIFRSGAWANYVYQVSSTFALASHTHTSANITDFNEAAQDAVGTILSDSSEIDFTYNDGTPSISASIVAGSIDETKLDASVNTSLDLADSSVQPNDPITDLNATAHRLFYSDGSGNVVELGFGTAGHVLKSNGATSAPSFQAESGGGNNVFNDIYIDQTGGTSDTYGVLAGSINGSNTLFTVSEGVYATGTLKVWLNGQLLTQGSGQDFVETTPASGTFTLAVAPVSGDEITAEYQKVVTNSDTIVTTTTVNELAQDAVGSILADSAEIDFTYNDGTPSITATIVAGSIDESKLDASVNASLDLADTAVQPATLSASGLGYVNHGATASTARPSGWAAVAWIGSVEPTNATNGDIWFPTA
jgi:hypothetical protein